MGYKGVLYAGLMINYNRLNNGLNEKDYSINFLEFNCRFVIKEHNPFYRFWMIQAIYMK